MIQALKSGDASYVLLDMYVPVTRKDLFNGSWFDVVDILEGEIQHGVLLQGDGVRLVSDYEELAYKGRRTNQVFDRSRNIRDL